MFKFYVSVSLLLWFLTMLKKKCFLVTYIFISLLSFLHTRVTFSPSRRLRLRLFTENLISFLLFILTFQRHYSSPPFFFLFKPFLFLFLQKKKLFNVCPSYIFRNKADSCLFVWMNCYCFLRNKKKMSFLKSWTSHSKCRRPFLDCSSCFHLSGSSVFMF